MSGPYLVVGSKPKTVTVDLDGKFVTVTNYRCVHDPKTEPEDPDLQDEAVEITMLPDAENEYPVTSSSDHPTAVYDDNPSTDVSHEDDRIPEFHLINCHSREDCRPTNYHKKPSFAKINSWATSSTQVVYARHPRLSDFSTIPATKTVTYHTECNSTTIRTTRIFRRPTFRSRLSTRTTVKFERSQSK